MGSVVGAQTRVGANAYIEGCVIGEGVDIGAGTRLEGLVVVGDRARIAPGLAIAGPAMIDVGEIREVSVADPAGGRSS